MNFSCCFKRHKFKTGGKKVEQTFEDLETFLRSKWRCFKFFVKTFFCEFISGRWGWNQIRHVSCKAIRFMTRYPSNLLQFCRMDKKIYKIFMSRLGIIFFSHIFAIQNVNWVYLFSLTFDSSMLLQDFLKPFLSEDTQYAFSNKCSLHFLSLN